MQGLQYLPNALTASRLVMAVPIALLILRNDYGWALGLGIVAGITDALDGFAARRLQAHSRIGAGMDAAADKLLMLCVFLALAHVGLLPWWLAAVVIGRDLVIVTGATAYHVLIGPFDFAPTALSKLNMGVQVVFLVAVLADALIPIIPPAVDTVLALLLAVMAIASGMQYVLSWSRRAVRVRGVTEDQ